MQYFISVLLSGIAVGGQYALIAIGYTMVYGILRLINFAHGDIFMAAGLIMGPACLGILTENDFIKLTAELGVIVLMFCAGMQTDIDELKKSGKAPLLLSLSPV